MEYQRTPTTSLLRRFLTAALLVAALAGVMSAAARSAQSPPAPVFPGAEWETITDPRAAGYCTADFAEATAHVQTLPTTAVMAIVGGRVLWQYGDVEAVSYLASVRKSILATMYGRYVVAGRIRLNANMMELGIDDVNGLLPVEKLATVEDLLTARSGVYHEAANAACTGCGSTAGDPPGARGTVPHGTYFLYNNWDFNALGTIFEQATGENIYSVFERDFARPLGFQDFDRDAQRKTVNTQRSVHAAYHFYLSTRDMARFGYLILRKGQWADTQIVPAGWVETMTRAATPVDQMNPEAYRQGPFGYGYLWWIWDGPHNDGIYKGAFQGAGAIGQFITVLPELDMVIAHKTRPQRGSSAAVGRADYLTLIEKITNARCR
jgi:CubicO group peptidase (beta-lactamase class C family)